MVVAQYMTLIVIFVVQVLFFGIGTLLLHRTTLYLGLTPMLFLAAGMMGLLNLVELLGLNIEISQGIVLQPGGQVYVPIILMTVLVLYVANGTRVARTVIYGILGVNVLILLMLGFLLLYLQVQEVDAVFTGLLASEVIITPAFLRNILASVVAFTLDLFTIIVVYQGIINNYRWLPMWMACGIALVIAVWVDTAVYNIVGLVGTAGFGNFIPGDILLKTIAAGLLWPLTGFYLTVIAPNLTNYVGPDGRRVLAIFDNLISARERLEQVTTEFNIGRAVYEQLTQHIPQIFWLMDMKKGTIIYFSPAFEQTFGYPREPFYRDPRKTLDLLVEEDRERIALNLTDFLTSHPETEFRVRTINGSVRWMRNKSFPIKLEDGTTIRYAGIAEGHYGDKAGGRTYLPAGAGQREGAPAV